MILLLFTKWSDKNFFINDYHLFQGVLINARSLKFEFFYFRKIKILSNLLIKCCIENSGFILVHMLGENIYDLLINNACRIEPTLGHLILILHILQFFGVQKI